MPQNALAANVAVQSVTSPHSYSALQLDSSGNLLTGSGSLNKLNVTAATVIKPSAGRACKVTVVAVATAGTFGVYDVATTGAAATANAIVQYTTGYPAVGSILALDFPCLTGIVVNPGTGGQVSVSYD
jgi:hypothetical protein